MPGIVEKPDIRAEKLGAEFLDRLFKRLFVEIELRFAADQREADRA